MHLDIATLGIIGILMTAVLSLGFTALASLLPTQRALWLWALVLWLATLGALFSALRGMFPGAVIVLGSNSCFVIANALILVGVAEHLDRPLDKRGPVALAIAFIAGFVFFDVVAPDIAGRMVLYSLQFIVWDVWIIALLLGAPASTRRSARVAIAVFAVNLLFNAIRIAALPAEQAGQHLESGPFMAATFVFGILMGLMKTFTLVLLVIEKLVDALRQQARIDGLTGLFNRDAILEEGEKALAACRRHQQPCAVLMFDLDNFKRINDQLGHGAGDAVLRHFAVMAREQCPEASPLLARYGGEEFLLVLPDTDKVAAVGLAEGMRQRLASTPARFGQQQIAVTTSIGIAIAGAERGSFEQVIARADDALYCAKANGRNRFAVAAPSRGDATKAVTAPTPA